MACKRHPAFGSRPGLPYPVDPRPHFSVAILTELLRPRRNSPNIFYPTLCKSTIPSLAICRLVTDDFDAGICTYSSSMAFGSSSPFGFCGRHTDPSVLA